MNNQMADIQADDIKHGLYDYLDDEYDYAPVKRGKPVNNNMATLKRVEGVINRYRKAGIL